MKHQIITIRCVPSSVGLYLITTKIIRSTMVSQCGLQRAVSLAIKHHILLPTKKSELFCLITILKLKVVVLLMGILIVLFVVLFLRYHQFTSFVSSKIEKINGANFHVEEESILSEKTYMLDFLINIVWAYIEYNNCFN